MNCEIVSSKELVKMGLRLRSKTDDVVIQLRWLVERDLSPTFYLKIHVVSEKSESMINIRENTHEFKKMTNFGKNFTFSTYYHYSL